MKLFEEDKHLRIPGPTPVPPSVQRAAAKPMINHRSDDFRKLAQRVRKGLQYVFQTENEVVVITGSGTAAMEAAVANLVSPGTRALVLVGGKFGERWLELVRAYRGDAVVLDYPYGQGAEPERVAAALRENPGVEVVFATQNESSTAVLNDIEGIAAAVRPTGALLVVDAISGLGGSPLPMDAWGVDVVVAGSQKCLMLPPGLSFVAANERAWERMAASRSPRYYLDLWAYRKAAAKGETPYTPNVSLFFALEESLRLIQEEGLERSFERHRLMRDMVRAGIKALGLPLYVDDRWASPTLTAVSAIPGLDVEAFRRRVAAEFRVILSGGQSELKGKIFRIGHMGYATPLDMLTALAAIELGLVRCGVDVPLGAGVRAAQEVLLKWPTASS